VNLLRQVKRLIEDPPPAHVFEISHAGVAFSRRLNKQTEMGFLPLEPDVLAISPLKDNVARPEVLFDRIRTAAPPNGKSRGRLAALILPDYCARVAVLDFDDLPSAEEERLALIRFRLKKSIPFDLESAAVSYHLQPSGVSSKKRDVVVAAVALEIVARYEAALRSAGFQTGFVTTSTLSALNLLDGEGVRVLVKLSGRVLTVTVSEQTNLRLLRCVELPALTPDDVLSVLFPTFAYAEDELSARPSALLLCGFGDLDRAVSGRAGAELGVGVKSLTSRLGEPDNTNAGLLGFLEAIGE